MPSAAELLEKPRFAALVGLVERLTGREVDLVPPATNTLGQGSQASPESDPAPVAPSRAVQVESVTPVSNGEAYQVDTVTDLGDGRTALSRFHVAVDLISVRASERRDAGPIAVYMSSEAVLSASRAPLALASVGADAVHVTLGDDST